MRRHPADYIKGLADLRDQSNGAFNFRSFTYSSNNPTGTVLRINTNIPAPKVEQLDAQGLILREFVGDLGITIEPDGHISVDKDVHADINLRKARMVSTTGGLSVKGRGATKKVLNYVTQRAQGLTPS